MEMASAVFPFLHIEIMPNIPSTILKIAINVANADTSNNMDIWLSPSCYINRIGIKN